MLTQNGSSIFSPTEKVKKLVHPTIYKTIWTLPCRVIHQGTLHTLIQITKDVRNVFSMGPIRGPY